MRIALIAPFAIHPKGTTRWRVLPLARALAAQGHAVRVVIPPYDWPAHGGVIWQDGGVQVVNVPVPARLRLAGHARAGRPAGASCAGLAARRSALLQAQGTQRTGGAGCC